MTIKGKLVLVSVFSLAAAVALMATAVALVSAYYEDASVWVNLCLQLSCLCLATAIGTCIAALIVRKNRRNPGHCEKCDYNLTGNTSGVCPECGTLITVSEA